MAGVQYPYSEKIVTNDVDIVEDDDHNKQEEQLKALTAARGGKWADDAGRPTPTVDNPYPLGYNVARTSYEYWTGSAWVQFEITARKGAASGYCPLDGSALIPPAYLPAGPYPPSAHKTSHESGGGDELSLAGMSGLLATPQTPASHASTHEGGSDPVTPAGIGADTPANRNAAIATHAGISAAHHTRPVNGELLPAAHASSHESGGADQMSVSGLLGLLGNAQTPLPHKNTHVVGGTDAFLITDVINALVTRFQDAGGVNWVFGALNPNEALYTSPSGQILGTPIVSPKKMVFALGRRTNNYGNYAVAEIGSNAQGYFSFYIPDDFNSLVSLKIIGIVSPAAAGTGKDIDLFTNYAQHGELYNTHAETDTTTTYDLSAESNRLYELDISGVFTGITAGDHCGIEVDHNSIGGSIYYLNIELEYN